MKYKYYDNNESKHSINININLPSPELKDDSYYMLSRVSAGTLEVLDIPIALTGALTSAGLGLAGGIVGSAGKLITTPTSKLTRKAFEEAEYADNKLAKAALYTGGAIAAIPTVAVRLVTDISAAVMTIGATVFGFVTFIASAPLAYAARGILKLGKKKYKYSKKASKLDKKEFKFVKNNKEKLIDNADEHYME